MLTGQLACPPDDLVRAEPAQVGMVRRARGEVRDQCLELETLLEVLGRGPRVIDRGGHVAETYRCATPPGAESRSAAHCCRVSPRHARFDRQRNAPRSPGYPNRCRTLRPGLTVNLTIALTVKFYGDFNATVSPPDLPSRLSACRRSLAIVLERQFVARTRTAMVSGTHSDSPRYTPMTLEPYSHSIVAGGLLETS